VDATEADDLIDQPVADLGDLLLRVRHTAASLAISAGANPKAVQTMLGHASAVLTLDTYPDMFPDDLEMVAAALDDARRVRSNGCANRLRTDAN
jgi:hypothetical protein